MIRFVIGSLVALSMMLIVDGAMASEPDIEQKEEAKAWFERGQAAYTTGDYESATRAFLSSYEIFPAPELLFNIAQAHRGAGKCQDAVRYYELARQAGLTLPESFLRLEAEAKQCTTRAAAPESTPAPVEEDSPRRASPPPEASPPVASESTADVTSAPAPPAALRLPEPTKESWLTWRRGGGIAALGAAAATTTLGIVFAIRATEAAERTSSLSKTPGATWDDAAQRNEASGKALTMESIGFFVASAVLTGTGIWLLWDVPDSPSYAWSMTPTLDGFSTSIHGHF